MLIKINKKWMVILSALAAVCVVLIFNHLAQRNSNFRNYSHPADPGIKFFGRLLDEDGKCVSFATIKITILRHGSRFSGPHRVSVNKNISTNKSGFFSVENEVGHTLIIDSVYKNGYLGKRFSSIYFFSPDEGPVYLPDSSALPVFTIHKQGPVTLLLKNITYGGFVFQNGKSDDTASYDLVEAVFMNEKKLAAPILNGLPLYSDFKIKATFDPNLKIWEMQISSGNLEGGVLLSKKLLYEAPADGYSNRLVVKSDKFIKEFGKTITRKKVDENGFESNGMYLYLKSRNPPIYSRLFFNRFSADANRLLLDGSNWVTNPFGERNLEQCMNIPLEMRLDLERRARNALRYNQRISPPNLSNFQEVLNP